MGAADSFLNHLPPDVISELINNSDNFSFIVELYYQNRIARELLDCQSRQDNPKLDDLVTDTVICDLLPSQQERLARLNEKFRLQVLPPLSFAKLIKAYNHSAHNPQYLKFESIVNCLKSAARLGYSDQLRSTAPGQPKTLYDIWLDTNLRFYPRETSTAALTQERWYASILYELSYIAYKHKHPELGDELSTEILHIRGRLTLDREYLYLRCRVRQILAPYKVKTGKIIRADHSPVLYATDVSDDIKKEIWATKYNLTNFPIPAGNDLVETAVLVKLGYFPKIIDGTS